MLTASRGEPDDACMLLRSNADIATCTLMTCRCIMFMKSQIVLVVKMHRITVVFPCRDL